MTRPGDDAPSRVGAPAAGAPESDDPSRREYFVPDATTTLSRVAKPTAAPPTTWPLAMLGIRFIKAGPTEFLLHHKRGRVLREGTGLSFFYFGPSSSLVLVPVASMDVPFIFEEITRDFQAVTVQGQVVYRVADPKKLSEVMNYTLASNGREYASEDPEKLPRRLVHQAQVLTTTALKAMTLREAVGEPERLAGVLRDGMMATEGIASLGVEVVALTLLGVRPTPETARALEAETRENILREADEAIFRRRNAAVEQERTIKENELNTEIAVENKKRQIEETKKDAERAILEKDREIREAEMVEQIALEQRRRELVGLRTANSRDEADARAYGMEALMKALGSTDAKVLQALATTGMDPSQLVALAFRDLADGAEKIGQLNVSPDLLRELLDAGSGGKASRR
jgi:regulator of protease activity HflC (stomatin/prohibitin superfamily)